MGFKGASWPRAQRILVHVENEPPVRESPIPAHTSLRSYRASDAAVVSQDRVQVTMMIAMTDQHLLR